MNYQSVRDLAAFKKNTNMKNRFIILVSFVLLGTLFSCVTQGVVGSGQLVSELRTVDSFTEITSIGSANITVSYGPIQSVEVTVDDNIIADIITETDGNKLIIRPKSGKSYSNINLSVRATLPFLTSINNTGSGEFEVSGFENLPSLSFKNTGSGRATLKGSCIDFSIENSGSGSVNGFDFISEICTIENTGSGRFEVNCSRKLVGENSGSGSIFYKGNPSINFENNGSGKIKDAN
mgnify:CR=1 FL=1